MTIPPELIAFLQSDLAAVLLVAAGLYLVPNKILLKVPYLGPVLDELLQAYTRRQIENRLKVERLVEEHADRVVESLEQLKRSGVIDSGTAQAQGVKALRAMFTLTPERAREYIEGAVYRLDSGPRPLVTLEAGAWAPAGGEHLN